MKPLVECMGKQVLLLWCTVRKQSTFELKNNVSNTLNCDCDIQLGQCFDTFVMKAKLYFSLFYISAYRNKWKKESLSVITYYLLKKGTTLLLQQQKVFPPQCKKIILCLIYPYLVFQSHWAESGFSLSQFVRIRKLRKPLSQGVSKKWI